MCIYILLRNLLTIQYCNNKTMKTIHYKSIKNNTIDHNLCLKIIEYIANRNYLSRCNIKKLWIDGKFFLCNSNAIEFRNNKISIEVRLGTNNAKKSIRLPTLKLDEFCETSYSCAGWFFCRKPIHHKKI